MLKYRDPNVKYVLRRSEVRSEPEFGLSLFEDVNTLRL